MTTARLIARSALVSAGCSLLPIGLLFADVATESERVWLVLSVVGLIAAILLVPAAVVVTAMSVGHQQPWRSAPWVWSFLAPAIAYVIRLLLMGQQRRLRFMWINDWIDIALEAVFVAMTLAILIGTTWRRAKSWYLPSVLWMAVGGGVWLLVSLSVPHTDVIGDGLMQRVALLPIWAIGFVPPFVTWTFPRASAAQPGIAVDQHLGRSAPSVVRR